MSSVSAYYHPLSFFAAGYHPRRPARCHSHILWIVGTNVSVQVTIVFETWVTRDAVSSLTSQNSSCITCMCVRKRQGERYICHYGGKSELVVLAAPQTSKCIEVCWTKYLNLGKSYLPEQLCPEDNALPTQPKPLGISWRSRLWNWWIGNSNTCIWDMLGLGPWYWACHVECVLSSPHMVVTPTINKPSTMPLLLSIDLQNLKIIQ